MWQEHNFKFSHQDLVSYIRMYLASCGITEYDMYQRSYDTEDWHGFKTHYDTCKICGLPAPYKIGHIQINIVNGSVSFRLVMQQERKLTEKEQKLYKTDVIKTSDDVWVFEMPDANHNERNKDHRSGYNFGFEIHEHNIQKFNDFLKIIFGTEYKTMYVVQLAAMCYEKDRKFKEFEELAANAWHLRSELWNTINIFATQWGECDRMRLVNNYNLSYTVENETEGQSQEDVHYIKKDSGSFD